MPTFTEFVQQDLVHLTALPEGVKNRCPICLEKFTTPCQTPCKHIFCRACLVDGWLSGQGNDAKNSCPECRRELFTLPGPGGEVPLLDLPSEHTEADLARATVAAIQHLEDRPALPAHSERLLVDVRFLGIRLYAMDNVVHERYQETGRDPREPFHRPIYDSTWISRRIYAVLQNLNGLTGDNYPVRNLESWLRHQILDELEANGVAVGTAFAYESDAGADVNMSDVDMLVRYTVCQCSRAYSDRQMRSQWTSLQPGAQAEGN